MPTVDELQDGPSRLIDFFDRHQLPCPEAMLFLTKDGVYAAQSGWVSMYEAEVGGFIWEFGRFPSL